jgi:hypothetical protein
MAETRVVIPEEVREKLEETVQSLKEFFGQKNVKFKVFGQEKDKDGIYIYFDFNRYVPLSEKEFEVLIESILNLGFYQVNVAEHQIANSGRYSAWLIYEEYLHFLKNVVISLKYYVTQYDDEMIYIDHISIATNAIRYEEEENEIYKNEGRDHESDRE